MKKLTCVAALVLAFGGVLASPASAATTPAGNAFNTSGFAGADSAVSSANSAAAGANAAAAGAQATAANAQATAAHAQATAAAANATAASAQAAAASATTSGAGAGAGTSGPQPLTAANTLPNTTVPGITLPKLDEATALQQQAIFATALKLNATRNRLLELAVALHLTGQDDAALILFDRAEDLFDRIRDLGF